MCPHTARLHFVNAGRSLRDGPVYAYSLGADPPIELYRRLNGIPTE